MSRVSTYLNFMGTTEEAFSLYSSVFGTEITGEIARMGDMPSGPGAPELSDAERKMVAHVELPILAGHVLMGTDMLASMGHELRIGNNVTICLEPDSRAETDRLALDIKLATRATALSAVTVRAARADNYPDG